MDRLLQSHIRQWFSFSSAFAYLFGFVMLVCCAHASALEVSAQQVAAFKSLSPSQQQAMASQYGIDVSSFHGSPRVIGSSTSAQGNSVLPRNEGVPLIRSQEEKSTTGLGEEGEASQALEPFGYSLFAGSPTTFAPINDVPVSSDYLLGPSDVLKVQLYGKTSVAYELAIDSEGGIYFPELGPISLAGMTFQEAKAKLNETIKQRMIGVKASISIGELRSIRVFVLGEAYVPGSYVVSSLSTITNALVLSGGIGETGSLRNIQLKRKGEVVQTLDLYKLLLEGDNREDVSLRSGDVVFIPPVGPTIGIDGEVRRPATYELKSGETTSDLIRFAGGMTPTAFPAAALMERIGRGKIRTVLDVNLSVIGGELAVGNGDVLTIPSVLDKLQDAVELKGHVYRAGMRNWSPGMRIADVLSSLDVVKPGADLRYGLIKRYANINGALSVLSFRPDMAMSGQATAHNLELKDKDEIYIFELYSGSEGDLSKGDLSDASEGDRSVVLEAVMTELRSQAEIGEPAQEVEVTGPVRFPGVYPLVDGMTALDLVYAAGGLTEKAYELSAEVNRTVFNSNREREQQRFELNLSSNENMAFEFQSRDVLQIRVTPEWAESTFVTLNGEVKFPGRYPVHKDDTLQDVIARAGGLTSYAYPEGAVFTRVELKEQQQKKLQEMQRRLAEDITKAQLTSEGENSAGSDDVATAQQLLAQLEQVPALGRLVIDLNKVLGENSDYQIVLQDGDELTVPALRNSVTVIGEVQLPVSQVYERHLSYLDYINRSGGTTNKADEDRIYIIKANGGVGVADSSSWFAGNSQVNPGDTIVVPLDADKLDQRTLWRDMSQIFYQIALGAAAVASL
jgi:polysaccharide export outer membrane protein